MADYISFNEGRKEIINNGLPATIYLLLSTKPCSGGGAHVVGDTLAGGVGEITGTTYARQTDSEPTATLANPTVVALSQVSWSTGAHTDWPSSVKSVVACTSADNSGKALCAWNLIAGGAARDLSQINTTELFTPEIDLS